MARTNDHFQFLMDIEPYQYGTDMTMNGLSVSVSYWKGTGFVAHYQAAERKGGCYSVVYDGSSDPLVAAVKVDIEPVSRNNVKRLIVIFESLRLAQEPIAWLFNHRMWDALNKFIAMVGKYGYAEQIKFSILGTIAEAEAKIKSLTNNTGTMKLNINNQNNETKNTVNNHAIALQGSEYTVKDPKTGKGVTFESAVPAAICEPIQDADFEEVTDNVPQSSALPLRSSKKVQNEQKTAPKKKQAISEAPQAQPVSEAKPSPSTEEQGEGLPQVWFSSYTTKKGDTAPQIIGFSGEDDPRWKSHKDAGHKYVSASYRRDLNGNKVYILLFGVRYMDVAKALAGAYNTADVNAWHRAEDACMAIYEQAQRDGKARWEEKKQAWAEKKNEERRMKNEESRAAESADKQVAAMLEKLMKGEDVPESILKHINPEVLAKFTKAA